MDTNPYQPPANPLREPLYPSPGGGEKPGILSILFSFKGRIPRSTYWLYSLLLVGMIVVVVSLVAPLAATSETGDSAEAAGALLILALVVPAIWISLALRVKRWHDRDKSGAWIFIGLIPMIGPLWTFVECGCLRGTVGNNHYGRDPI